MTLLARVALVAGLALVAAPAFASTKAGNPDTAPVAKASLLQFAQGMTPEGWRVEGPPRYKKASTKSTTGEVTKFRDEPARYKKATKPSSGTTGSGH